MGAEQKSLTENFLRFFYAEIADSPDSLREVFELRYRVYCEEFQYESAYAFPDCLETDAFDQQSISCLIRHRASGRPAGCVRLVQAEEDLELPLEHYCGDSIFEDFRSVLASERDGVCEISRLAVNSDFRRRPRERMSRFGQTARFENSLEEQRTFPLIAVAAFLAAAAVSELTDRTRVFAMMEPFLPRMLKHSGIPMQPAGAEVDYHGLRAAYFTTTEAALAGLNHELLLLYMAIRDSLAVQVNSKPRYAE